jgi:hypothetical protein
VFPLSSFAEDTIKTCVKNDGSAALLTKMSALGQKRTLTRLDPMSALPPKADTGPAFRNVRYVPLTDISRAWKSGPYFVA